MNITIWMVGSTTFDGDSANLDKVSTQGGRCLYSGQRFGPGTLGHLVMQLGYFWTSPNLFSSLRQVDVHI